MRCQKCGAIIAGSYVQYNGVLLCPDCARELKVEDAFKRQASFFEQAFPMLGELTNGLMGSSVELDFGNNKIRCPKCGTSLRELDSKGVLGCIECYNTFNETVLKNILKKQGSSEYIGRKPGEFITIEAPTKAIDDEDTSGSRTKEEKKEEKKTSSDSVNLETLRNSDWANFPDEVLEAGMKAAAQAEDYKLAARLRDELKSRKEDN